MSGLVCNSPTWPHSSLGNTPLGTNVSPPGIAESIACRRRVSTIMVTAFSASFGSSGKATTNMPYASFEQKNRAGAFREGRVLRPGRSHSSSQIEYRLATADFKLFCEKPLLFSQRVACFLARLGEMLRTSSRARSPALDVFLLPGSFPMPANAAAFKEPPLRSLRSLAAKSSS